MVCWRLGQKVALQQPWYKVWQQRHPAIVGRTSVLIVGGVLEGHELLIHVLMGHKVEGPRG